MSPKQRAAHAALPLVRSGMVIGLGTGTTADCFLEALGEAIRSGRLSGIRGVPTSIQSHRRAVELGIPVATLDDCPRPDLTVDGCDELTGDLDLIKGLGGALLREKIVAQASGRLVIIADESKRVTRLGLRSPLPVEVVAFAHRTHADFLRGLGAEPILRLGPDGGPFITDNGNHIYDCRFSDGIGDPAALERRLKGRAGVVETGLFLGMASEAFIADEKAVWSIGRGSGKA